MGQRKSLQKEVISRLKLFLGASDYLGAENLLKASQLDVKEQNHKLLKEIVTLSPSPEIHRFLEWIIKQGNYRQENPEIALFIYCGTGNDKEVKALINRGIDPTQNCFFEENDKNLPKDYSKPRSPAKFALVEDQNKCLRNLLGHPKVDRNIKVNWLLSSCYLESEKCCLEMIKEFSKNDQELENVWDLWVSGHSHLPEKIAKTLVKKLHTDFLKDQSLELDDKELKKIVNHELGIRLLKQIQSQNQGIELV